MRRGCIGIALFKPHFHLGNVDDYRRSLMLLYGADTVRQAEALLDRSERFFGLDTLSPDMQGSAMHRRCWQHTTSCLPRILFLTL